MSQTGRLLRSPSTFRRLIGLDPAAFRQLQADVRPAWDRAEGRRQERPGRRRPAGAGRKFTLPLPDRLLMLLIYYRTSVPHPLLGFRFRVDDSTMSRNNRRLEPLPAENFRIPERRVDLRPDEVRELFSTAPSGRRIGRLGGRSGMTAARSGGTRSSTHASCGAPARRLGRKRVVAEQGIGKLKVWRIAAERHRNPRRRHMRMMKNVSGLHNRMFAA